MRFSGRVLFAGLGSISLLSCSLGGASSLSPTAQSSSYAISSSSTSVPLFTDSGIFTEKDYLKASGERLRNNYGFGDVVTLRGTNIGGYLVIEQWMTALKGSSATGYLDHKTITNLFLQRFGEEKTLDLWAYYRNNYFTDQDFDAIQAMGMNLIRLPFTYMSLDPAYHNVPPVAGQEFNFSLLDSFIAKAAKRGIYTILDLHGAYGSQNGQDHSGESLSRNQVDFYSNEEKMSKTIHLWASLTEHYKDNPAIAGFDLLNEPGEKAESTGLRHWAFYDRLNDAVRAIDEDRLLIYESCWDGKNLPSPKLYGWNNCMYSFHNYSGSSDYEENAASYSAKFAGVEEQGFGVPLFMGEFNCYGNKTSWIDVLGRLRSKGWSFSSWTYKINLDSPSSYPGWGIVETFASPVVPDEDDEATIKSKWYQIDSAYDGVLDMSFSDGTKLKDLMAIYCQK